MVDIVIAQTDAVVLTPARAVDLIAEQQTNIDNINEHIESQSETIVALNDEIIESDNETWQMKQMLETTAKTLPLLETRMERLELLILTLSPIATSSPPSEDADVQEKTEAEAEAEAVEMVESPEAPEMLEIPVSENLVKKRLNVL